MEFRTLRYFVYVAEARSFSLASQHLRIAQPALSRQIGKLEAEIGLRLFVRTGRRLELTEAGEQLLARAQSLLRQATNTIEELRTFNESISGTVTIGVSPSACEVLPPIILKERDARYPQLQVRFVEGFSSLILGQLLKQELTMCLIHNPTPHSGLEVLPLYEDAMYLIGPPRAVGAIGPVTPEMRVDGLPMVLPNQRHGLRLALEQALGNRLNIDLEADGIVTTRGLVVAGAGYTIMPYSAIRQQLLAGQVSGKLLSDLDIAWTLSLVHRLDQPSARTLKAMLTIVQAAAADLVAAGGEALREARR